MIKRLAVGIFVLILMFAFSGTIQNGIHGLRTDEVVQNEEVITTSETEWDIILDSPLFNGAVSEVDSIISTDGDDIPLADSYDEDTDTLTVSGLDTSTTRTLTITYYTEVADQFMPVVGPFLSFLIFGGIIAAVIVSIWKGRN
jgi:hypothetical protein